jgi:hypothetical protein
MFSFSSFSCVQLCFTSRHFRSGHEFFITCTFICTLYIYLYIHLLLLALSRQVDCCLYFLATNSSANNFKTGRGSPAHVGSLPLWAPDGPRRMSCGQGLPPLWPDGAVAKGPEEGGLGDEVYNDNDDDVDDDSLSSYSERWVPGSGMHGSFGLAG